MTKDLKGPGICLKSQKFLLEKNCTQWVVKSKHTCTHNTCTHTHTCRHNVYFQRTRKNWLWQATRIFNACTELDARNRYLNSGSVCSYKSSHCGKFCPYQTFTPQAYCSKVPLPVSLLSSDDIIALSNISGPWKLGQETFVNGYKPTVTNIPTVPTYCK